MRGFTATLFSLLCLFPAPGVVRAQAPPAKGRAQFERLCARCHGADGHGGEFAPDIVGRLAARTDPELATLVRQGLPAKGMPGVGATLAAPDLRALVAFLRTLTPRNETPVRARVETIDGRALEGLALNRSSSDLQLLTDDGRLHLLRRNNASDSDRSADAKGKGTGVGTGTGERYRSVTSQVDWPTYNGQPDGNRFSPLDQINRSTVARLAPAWTFALSDASRLEVTPVVVDGVMYVTNANECYALDAGSGRRIWRFHRPRTKGLAGDAASGINRGVAVAGDRVFMVTDHAHLLALDRFTGALVWETTMADWRQNYGATSAPLVAGDLVISGVSGGDEGIRGFVAAFDRATGKEAWRFWTVPRPGEPGSETWRGTDIAHPCAATWLTGTYDAALQTVYWPTGNPCPDYDGSQRLGDNLYSDSILALDQTTGRLKWHFQYTPHDLWDWDAQQPPVLVDTTWQGQPRKLLLHANRNGFFYVLDRTTGALLLAKPFVKLLTWAREIGADGRPVTIDGQEPTRDGTRICPAVEGATNWFSTAFHPATGLYYVQTLEKCTIYHRKPETWRAGQSYYGGSTTQVPEEPGQKVLRAIDVQTGAIKWELPQIGHASSWGGALATAGGLVIFGEDSGALMAVDASSGKVLWQFQTSALWKASPMTYVFDGRQHVAVAAGPAIIAFALLP
jgi:alcohol dehydrogenase (cytochrome c)